MTFTRGRSAILVAVLKAGLHSMMSLRSFVLATNFFFARMENGSLHCVPIDHLEILKEE